MTETYADNDIDEDYEMWVTNILSTAKPNGIWEKDMGVYFCKTNRAAVGILRDAVHPECALCTVVEVYAPICKRSIEWNIYGFSKVVQAAEVFMLSKGGNACNVIQ